MYSYIKGEITEIKATHITIEAYGIGYFVKVPNPYSFNINTQTIVYLHHHVREDAIELFEKYASAKNINKIFVNRWL